MTYFPHISTAASDGYALPSNHLPLTLPSQTLLHDVGCLLHCPTDTPQLWSQVLAALGNALSCSSAQLFLSVPFNTSTETQYAWEARQNDRVADDDAADQPCCDHPLSDSLLSDNLLSDNLLSGRPLLEEDLERRQPTAAVLKLLWQHFDIPEPDDINILSPQYADLRSQLATLVLDGRFHLSGIETHAAGQWPALLQQLFGQCHGHASSGPGSAGDSYASDHHIALLPLCYRSEQPQCSEPLHFTNGAGVASTVSAEQPLPSEPSEMTWVVDCAGVLILFRSVSGGDWCSADLNLIDSVGSQIYLAMRRSRLDQVNCIRSSYDPLTHLPDRVLFNQQLVRSLATCLKQDTMLGVAFLDLDRFKNINDTLGHEVGDLLLQQVAERLQGCLRGYDVVARWGGDEFTLLLSALRSPEDVSNISERILHRLAVPFNVQGEELYVTASLGIALAPYDGEDEPTLLRNADAAMYQAKARGRNNYQIYFEEINANARSQLNLETDLRKAVDNGDLFLCYQPQVDLATGQWLGMEALIRWRHPSLGIIAPSKFIPIAEETGLIEPIGHWVLHASCSQYCQWHQMGLPPMRLAVNLSPHQFHRSHLVRSVMQIVNSTGFDPRYLELEVTESAAMHDVDFAIDVLKKLSNTGMQIAMDDFGTGYSSLSVLKHFPLDTIKIDRSFVKDLVESPSDAAIASTIIALAKGLNFKVLAEGIENAEQVTVLSKMGCDYAQGYWFSHPLNVQTINELLTTGQFHQVAKHKQPISQPRV